MKSNVRLLYNIQYILMSFDKLDVERMYILSLFWLAPLACICVYGGVIFGHVAFSKNKLQAFH